MNFNHKLKDKKVIITGGSSGIGRAAAGIFAGDGAGVSLVSRRGDVLRQAVDEIVKERGGACPFADFFALDVSKEEDVKDFAGKYVDIHGVPDVLVNCAGVADHPGPFEDLPSRDFRELMEINFFGTVNMCRSFIPLMKKQGGDIVNVSSVAGLSGGYGFTAYSSSKFAVTGFTLSLRSELKKHGINVTLFCPACMNSSRTG
ncbi:MAG: hypothetical protein CVV44_06715 [Spirochaetae bacterium HGW-Spirochaetae-1]|jgi:NAD(P)-dependent dehydrogenase (short-subunit alcohol dehydrogenase family)|nr:MAG: hypothetical protein CVV44_06715 [Spirochaetae bacterium HGW-Spirochaetae-1]